MGRVRRNDKREDAQLTERVQLLAERLWHRNQARMAGELGVSRPVISRVLTGKQQPTGKLLAALLRRHPEVNLHWLLTGQGEPLLEPGAAAGGGRLRPVVEVLLPGSPEEYPGLLSGLGYPVAAGFYSPSSYWYRVPGGAAVVGSAEKVTGNDLLLMETDRKWTGRWEAVLEKYCAFRLGTGRRERVVLGKVDPIAQEYFKDYERYRVEFFGRPGDAWLIVADTPADVAKGRRAVPGVTLVLEQVAGVCLLLQRPFERRWTQGEEGSSGA